MSEYLYIGPRLDGVSTLTTDALAETTERHHLVLGTSDADDRRESARRGQPAHRHRRRRDRPHERHSRSGAAAASLQPRSTGACASWLYWPAEQAVECVDRERLQSLQRHRRRGHRDGAPRPPGAPRDGALEASPSRASLDLLRGRFPIRRGDLLAQLERWSLDARPVPVPRPHRHSEPGVEARRGLVPADRLLGADLVGRQLRSHLLRREGARGDDRAGSRACCRSATPCSTRSACRRWSMDPPPNFVNEDGDGDRVRSLLPERQDGVPAAATGIHLRTAVPGQLGRGAAEPRAADSVSGRVQRLRDVDAAQLQQHGAVSTRTST